MTDKKYKIVLLGESNTGKTSLMYRIRYSDFHSENCATVGCEFYSKPYVYDNKEIKFLFWDTSGQEVFRAFTPQFSRNARLALVFFDLNSDFDEKFLTKYINEWIKFTPSDCCVLVIPTKFDLCLEKSLEDYDLVKKLQFNRNIYFAEPTSSKTNHNIKELQIQMAQILIKHFYDPNDYDNEPDEVRIDINNTDSIEKDQNSECCST